VIRFSKVADERREAGAIECWLLHGAVGMAADWRAFAKRLADAKVGTRAVDMWRFLENQPLPLAEFGAAFNADAAGEVNRGNGRVLMGYSMGGRLALHALLEKNHPWQAAVIVSAHPGLADPAGREARRTADAEWAARALTANWQEFLNAWQAQPVLGTPMPRDAGTSAAMTMRRREIARGFFDWSLGMQEPLWDRLSEINIPILWVAGEKDAKFLELARRAVAALPQARLAAAPGAGHRVPWEAEEWLARETAGFLTSGVAASGKP
jgi:2-succinyl-6-hydroxy-2,4-cyclohexadiene-1-carboxylate synthase